MQLPTRRKRCPSCRGLDVIPILYGLHAFDMAEAEDRGEIIIGGALPFAEEWHCRVCGSEWGKAPTEILPSRHQLSRQRAS